MTIATLVSGCGKRVSRRWTGDGAPLKVVSEVLGHSSVAITGDIYGHVSPDVARQAIDLLGDALDR
jgi:integrase